MKPGKDEYFDMRGVKNPTGWRWGVRQAAGEGVDRGGVVQVTGKTKDEIRNTKEPVNP